MAGSPCFMVELTTDTGTEYLGTHDYVTRSSDTPASQYFEARIMGDLSFTRSVGFFAWDGNSRPRGAQNFGTITLANPDGRFDSLIGKSLRDKSVVVKRGETADAYSTFTTVATLVIDRIEFPDEITLTVYVKDLSALLERALQQNSYPATVNNVAVRGRSRPVVVGCAFQVPMTQPDPFGNGHFDIHDSDKWLGVTQLLDQGATPIEGTGYRRSARSGIYGIERQNAIGGKQLANVAGAWKLGATEISDDFANLTGWTESNGGVAGRDASIVSNQLSLVNTAGGADLILLQNTTITATATDLFFYEFDVVSVTSGSAQLRSTAAAIERTIDAPGRYTGVIQSAASWTPRLYAVNGSNCSMIIDNFRIRRVTLIEGLQDVVKFLATNDSDCQGHGPLTVSQLDTTALSTLESAVPYKFGFWDQGGKIADWLDRIANSIGGWWYINRTGKLTMGQLTAPSGTAVLTLDQTSVQTIRPYFDAAPGLSTRILAKPNWDTYSEGELLPALNYVQLNSADKDADVTLSGSNYAASIVNAGSVRSTPALHGERVYFEVKCTLVDAGQNLYIGVGNSSAAIGAYPGSDANSIGYRANGQRFISGSGAAYGATFATNDVIGVAIDGRPAARGSRQNHFRVYFYKNGVAQNSGNPDTEAGFIAPAVNATGLAYAMIGDNAVATVTVSVNLGQSAFAFTPPSDYIAPAHHRALLMEPYRYVYTTTTAVAAAYAHAIAYSSDDESGNPTVLSRAADAVTECDRRAALYASEKFFHDIVALLDGSTTADTLEPGDVIEVTWPRYSYSAKKMRVVSVSGALFSRQVRILAWG